jgi:hypothetical protein
MPRILLRSASDSPPTIFRIKIRGGDLKGSIEDDPFLLGALTDVERHDDRAEYADDSFAIEAVKRKGHKVLMTYKYEWGAHYGCADMCRADVETEDVEGRIEDGHVVFVFEVREPRSTDDEF